MPLPGIMRRWPRASALALGLLGATGVFVAAEVGLRVFATPPRPVVELDCKLRRPELGGGYRANCSARWIGRMGKRPMYDVGFTSDAYGRRLTPQSAPGSRHRLALFMGCSFTIGMGVEDDETIPFLVGEAAPSYRVLNYGGAGFGPQHMLVHLERGLSAEELGPFEGPPLMIYTLIPAHIHRASGNSTLMYFTWRFPAYALAPGGGVAFEGTMAAAHPWRRWLARGRDWSRVLNRLPEPPIPGEVELTAQILLESRRRFQERLGSDRFVVLAYPGLRTPSFERLLARLRELGVAVLDPKDVITMGKGLRFADSHPTAEAQRRVAARLATDLGKLGWLDNLRPEATTASR